jgi:hypothetical protein
VQRAGEALFRCLERRIVAAAFVPVPEAAVDEQRDLQLREYQIGRSGQISAMKPEAKSQGMRRFPYAHFRSGVLAPYAGHVSRTLGRAQPVHHGIVCPRGRHDRTVSMKTMLCKASNIESVLSRFGRLPQRARRCASRY